MAEIAKDSRFFLNILYFSCTGRLGEASRESRETRRSFARVSRDNPREVARRARDVEKISHNAPETRRNENWCTVCCRDVKVAASGVYDVRERIISSFP